MRSVLFKQTLAVSFGNAQLDRSVVLPFGSDWAVVHALRNAQFVSVLYTLHSFTFSCFSCFQDCKICEMPSLFNIWGAAFWPIWDLFVSDSVKERKLMLTPFFVRRPLTESAILFQRHLFWPFSWRYQHSVSPILGLLRSKGVFRVSVWLPGWLVLFVIFGRVCLSTWCVPLVYTALHDACFSSIRRTALRYSGFLYFATLELLFSCFRVSLIFFRLLLMVQRGWSVPLCLSRRLW